MNGNHLKYLLLGGAGIFGALLVVGAPLSSALLAAVLLACPLMMVFMMGGGQGGQGGHGGHGASNDQTITRRDEQTNASDRPRGHQH